MDFSHPFGDGTEPASFLYAMPLPDGSTFFEETCLVRRPGLGLGVLEGRLHARLAAAGVRLGPIAAVERCVIPLDVPIDRGDGALRFGAAAGMVHPATGFLLGRVLRAAPTLAAALAAGDARTAWRALWPGDALRRAHLFRYGAAALGRLDADGTRAFFRAFFGMPLTFTTGYVGDRLSAGELARGMATLFGRLPRRVALALAAGGPLRELLSAARPALEDA
jgi:lycopene beta-cyclase